MSLCAREATVPNLHSGGCPPFNVVWSDPWALHPLLSSLSFVASASFFPPPLWVQSCMHTFEPPLNWGCIRPQFWLLSDPNWPIWALLKQRGNEVEGEPKWPRSGWDLGSLSSQHGDDFMPTAVASDDESCWLIFPPLNREVSDWTVI